MKIKHLTLFIILFCFSIYTFSQSDSTTFKPSGKVFGVSFFDYSSGLNSHSNNSGFDITRALLGYKYQFLESLTATIAIDGAAGRSTDDKLQVNLRNAFLSWEEGAFKLDVGLATLKQFSLQQDMWGHRYALQSQQDMGDLGQSVDIGAVATYTFCPFFSADLSITNGEGYKTIRKDKSMKYSIGATLKSKSNLIFRLYGDVYTTDRDQFDKLGSRAQMKNQFTTSAFIGYDNDLIVAGIEYNLQFNNQYVRTNNVEGFSVFSTIYFHPKWNAYARYDYYDSSLDKDEQVLYDDRQLMIAGIEFSPISNLKFSPNFRNINYSRSKSEQYIFISGEFKF